MNMPLIGVALSVECVIPHDMAALNQGQIIEAIAGAMVEGGMFAGLQIRFADQAASLRDVHQAIKPMWLARLAANPLRFIVAKAEAVGLPLNEAAQLEEDCLIWSAASAGHAGITSAHRRGGVRMFVVLLVVLGLAFSLGYWYRGWVHTITINDPAGEYLGG